MEFKNSAFIIGSVLAITALEFAVMVKFMRYNNDRNNGIGG